MPAGLPLTVGSKLQPAAAAASQGSGPEPQPQALNLNPPPIPTQTLAPYPALAPDEGLLQQQVAGLYVSVHHGVLVVQLSQS